MLRVVFLFLFCHLHAVYGQVSYIAGSYDESTASGSGAGGTPTFSYTTSAGTDRLLVFYMVFERDHLPGSTGDNWASDAPLGGSVPTVELGGVTLSHLSSQWVYEYNTIDDESDAEISLELLVYGTLEANIPAGTNSFSLTANYSNPSNSGDEAIFGAMMFENVNGMTNLANSNCNACNSISTSAISPDDGNNAVFSVVGASSNRTITSGSSQTILGNTTITNTNGNYTNVAFSEEDGISSAAQYKTGTILTATNDFSATGSADMFGMLESAFRITSPTQLPVELIKFEAANTKLGNLLQWTTASEINNDKFEVEKSTDGVNWFKIAEVQGNGNAFTEINYSYLDEHINDADIVFYRLKQIDFDGTSEYSNKTVARSPDNANIQVFPTNATSTISVASDKIINRIDVINLNGQLVLSSTPFNTFSETNITQLPTGNYILRIIVNGAVYNEKVYVQ